MDKELETILQDVADYLGCPIACARSPKFGEFYFHAYLKGVPSNLVDFASKGKASTLEQDGYNACIEKDENGNEFYHRVDECNNVFILPIKSKEFVSTIIEPKTDPIVEE